MVVETGIYGNLWANSISIWQVGRTQHKTFNIWREEVLESSEWQKSMPPFSPPESSSPSLILVLVHQFIFWNCVHAFPGLLYVVKEQVIMGEIANLTYPDLLGWPKRFFLDKFKIKNCWKNENQHSGRRSPWGETPDRSKSYSAGQRPKGIHLKETKSKATLIKARKAL